MNTQARDLELGSGGFDVLYANLTRGLGLAAEAGAHVMKLPYTPLQAPRGTPRRTGPLAATLDGMPVVCCSLHSQVAPVCAALAGLRVAYVQLPGGALPVALSDTVRALEGTRPRRARGRRRARASAGDVECVIHLVGARLRARAGVRRRRLRDRPGHRRDRVRLRPRRAGRRGRGERRVLARRPRRWSPRASPRPIRGSGIGASRTTRGRCSSSASATCRSRATRTAEGWREACDGLPLSHMGRGPDEDPAFFAAAFAAGRLASTARDRGRVRPPMRIGVAKEIKPDEYRVALTPAGARELVQRGHEVARRDAARARAARSRTTRTRRVGARIGSVDEVWDGAELVLKVKEPIAGRVPAAARGPRPLHLPPPRRRRAADRARSSRAASPCVAYETVETDDRRAAAARADERDRRPARRPGRRVLPREAARRPRPAARRRRRRRARQGAS